MDKKMDIVMDVKVQVTVQLGTAQLPMKEIVELSPRCSNSTATKCQRSCFSSC